MSASPGRRASSAPEVAWPPGREPAPVLTPSELAALRQQAQTQGFEQGLAEGRAAAEAALQRERASLHRLLAALAQPLRQVSREVMDELTLLALTIARQVLRQALDQHPEQIVPIVQQALAALPAAAREIRLQLHPSDLPRVQQALSTEALVGITLQEDSRLQPGGCLVTCDRARVDEQLETRLARVVARLLEAQPASEEAAAG